LFARVTGRVGPVADQEAARWASQNSTRQSYEYSLYRRFLNHGTEYPFLFAIYAFVAFIALCGIFGVILYSLKDKLPLLPEFDMVAFVGVPWSVQATFIALVYPIVLSFMALLLQRKVHSTLLLRVYIIESGIVPAGASSVALVAILGIQYFITPYTTKIIFATGYSTQILVASFIAEAAWFLVNLYFTMSFLGRTISFVQEKIQREAFTRVAVNIALRQDLRIVAKQSKLLQTKLFSPDFSYPGTRTGVSISLRRNKVLYDVRTRLLSCASGRWTRRVTKNIVYRDAHITFLPMIGVQRQDNVVLCQITNGPELNWWERFLIKRAFVFCTPKTGLSSISVTTMFEEFGAEVMHAANDGNFSQAVDSLHDFIQFHNRMLKASVYMEDGREKTVAVYNMTPGQLFANDAFDRAWLNPYLELNKIAVRALQDDNRLFRKLAEATEGIVYGMPPNLEQIRVQAHLIVTQLAAELAIWWGTKFDEVDLKNDKDFRSALPAHQNNVYKRAVTAIVETWGALTIYDSQYLDLPHYRQWQFLRSRVLTYVSHVDSLSTLLLKAVSRRDEVASLQFASCFVNWWNQRKLQLRLDYSLECYFRKKVNVDFVSNTWLEVETILSDTTGQLTMDVARDVLHRGMKSYWENMRVFVIFQLMSHAESSARKSNRELALTALLLEGKTFRSNSRPVTESLATFDDVLCAFFRAAFGFDGENSRLEKFNVSQDWERTEMVAVGWPYHWQPSSLKFTSMYNTHAALLVALAGNSVAKFSNSLAFIWECDGDIDKLANLKSYLLAVKNILESPNFLPRWVRPIRRLNGHLDRTDSLKFLLMQTKENLAYLIDYTEDVRNRAMVFYRVAEERIELFRRTIAEQVFDVKWIPDYVSSYVFFVSEDIPDSAYTFEKHRAPFLEKIGGQADSILLEENLLLGLIKTIHSNAFKEKIELERVAPILLKFDSAGEPANHAERQTFIREVVAACEKVRSDDMRPIIFAGNGQTNSCFNEGFWKSRSHPLPDGVAFSVVDIKTGKRAFALNDAPIALIEIEMDGCYVAPAEWFSTLHVSAQSMSVAISLDYKEVDGREELKFILSCTAGF
jgi:hypothetical protein